MKRIQIFVTPNNSSGVNNVSGILSLRSEGKLLAVSVVRSHVPDLESKRVEKALRKNTVIVEFYIASDSIASSKCAISIMDPDGSGFSEYWFYIGDLCKK